ncbi:MAG: alpha-amylase family glycosyl hydrolase [Candidatus Sulfotelmatobacter sp.]
MPSPPPNRFFTVWLLMLVVLQGGLVAVSHGASITGANPPRVEKIEPPNWWIGLPDPMLLLSGENLAGARVSTSTPGVRVVRILDGLSPHYLFVWLKVIDTASPGSVRLEVLTEGGHQEVDLRLDHRDAAAETPNEKKGFNGFGPDDVIYLIMPDRFDDGDTSNNFSTSGAYDRNSPLAYHGGDLRGIQQRLPYLKDLGVTTIWITPVYQNDDRTGRDYHGYGAIDLYAVEKHLGTLADYRSLVNAAHEQGMKVLLDIVPNHVGPTNPWVENPPTARWFHGTREKHLDSSSPFAVETDPHAPPLEWRDAVEGWFAGILPDMGTDDPITSQYLRQNALWWAETGALDGFRIDTFPYVDRPFWRDFHADVHRAYPRFRTVGEVFNPDPTVTAFFVGGKITEGIDTGLDTVFDFPLAFTIRKVVLQGASARQLEEVLRHDWMFPHPENLVTFFDNHDTKRFMGEPGATTQKLKLALSLLLTLRGIPEIYYGDEIGMPGGDDPDNRRDFPGGFPGDKRDAFTSEGRTSAEQSVFTHVRDLLRMRHEHPALRGGELVHFFGDDQVLAYIRQYAGGPGGPAEQLLMVMNNADQPRTVEFDISDTPIATTRSVTTLMGTGEAERVNGPRIRVPVAPRSLGIYQLK